MSAISIFLAPSNKWVWSATRRHSNICQELKDSSKDWTRKRGHWRLWYATQKVKSLSKSWAFFILWICHERELFRWNKGEDILQSTLELQFARQLRHKLITNCLTFPMNMSTNKQEAPSFSLVLLFPHSNKFSQEFNRKVWCLRCQLLAH